MHNNIVKKKKKKKGYRIEAKFEIREGGRRREGGR